MHVDHKHVPAERAQEPVAIEADTMTAERALSRQLKVFRQIWRGQIKTTVVVAIIDPWGRARLHVLVADGSQQGPR